MSSSILTNLVPSRSYRIIWVIVLLSFCTAACGFLTTFPLKTISGSQFSRRTFPIHPKFCKSKVKKSATKLFSVDNLSVDVARNAFFLWFFGASGGAGIAVSAFFKMIKKYQLSRQLGEGQAQTIRSDEIVPLSIICGYSHPIYKNDVFEIINNTLSVEEIIESYPIENNFLSKNGYLTYQAYALANKDCNPFAVRVLFDSFNTNSDVCPPMQAQDRLNSYKEDVSVLAVEVLFAKLRGFLAIFTLLFLFSLAYYEAFVVFFREGWFPEWPGLSNLPYSLIDPELGITSIPKYWLLD